MRRISVVGNSGSGKSTFARRLAERLDVTHLELDSLYHLPGWQGLPTDVFRQQVADRVSAEGWVIDGNYSAVRDLVWERADTVVWLDHPRRVVMPRVVRRTVGRAVLRRELWNGNREAVSNLWSADPRRSIIAWAWTQHAAYRERYAHAFADARWAHLRLVRLGSPGQARDFLRSVPRA